MTNESFQENFKRTRQAIAGVTDEQALSAIEGVIRSMPAAETFHHDDAETLIWVGAASAAIQCWDNIIGKATWETAVGSLHARSFVGSPPEVTMKRLLYQAHAELRQRSIGPVSVAIGKGEVFRYFDNLRKIIQEASEDILFVDPYLEAKFVSNYLPYVKAGVQIRLLTQKRMSELLPAVEHFSKENSADVFVRKATDLHDRWVFIDKRKCFQSGASFKDGATSVTTISQVTDAFSALQMAYDQIWSSASQKFPEQQK